MILIAEDNSVVANYLKAHLKLKGYEAIIADDGHKAWLELEKHHASIFLVVTDVAMPNMSGLALVEKMRANKLTENIPVIFASGVASTEMVSQAAKLGKVHFLVKPLTMEALLPKVHELVPFSVPVLRDKEQVKREFHLDDAAYRKIAGDFQKQVEQAIVNINTGLRTYTIFKELNDVKLLCEGADLLGAFKLRTLLKKMSQNEDVELEQLMFELRAVAEALKHR